MLSPVNAGTRPAAAGGWHTPVPDDHPAAAYLSAAAVRRHTAPLMERARHGESDHFKWHDDRLAGTAAFVASVIRDNYPDLKVPYHARWRHFEAGGADRWADTAQRHGLAALGTADPQRLERARSRVDLAITSVLLDAGAGPDWRYADTATGLTLARSEGLGVASLRLFETGAFSSDPAHPLRADGKALASFTADKLAAAFQVREDNPLVGVEGRAALIARLGEVVQATPAVFSLACEPGKLRLGHLVDTLFLRAPTGRVAAADVLALLLRALGPVWPSKVAVSGIWLGDCWPHPHAPGGLVPFHKLTQWLTYSLLEPLEDAGLTITDLDQLTGLPEYRNGGLLLDSGLLEPLQDSFFTTLWRVDAQPIVEWRALTVMGLDLLADAVRAELGLSAEAFPLARVLEGGTWAAGRRIAAQKREGGGPPLRIELDGTVF
ncbi:MAG: DUF1688 family protein [Aquabacterium sp.]|nr:MAG: DUF1688 family protein [Aquabacterium sp.]